MSVALLISTIDGEEVKGYVPVATESFFEKYWNPIIEKLGFEWLPMMQTGFPITEDDLPYVMAELQQLQQQLPSYYSLESNEYEHINARLTTLIMKLEALKGKKIDLFLG